MDKDGHRDGKVEVFNQWQVQGPEKQRFRKEVELTNNYNLAVSTTSKKKKKESGGASRRGAGAAPSRGRWQIRAGRRRGQELRARIRRRAREGEAAVEEDEDETAGAPGDVRIWRSILHRNRLVAAQIRLEEDVADCF